MKELKDQMRKDKEEQKKAKEKIRQQIEQDRYSKNKTFGPPIPNKKYPKILTMFYHRVLYPNDTDRMANSVNPIINPDQTASLSGSASLPGH